MEQKAIFKVLSFVGLALGGIGTLLSSWAENKEQDAMIEEKVNGSKQGVSPRPVGTNFRSVT